MSGRLITPQDSLDALRAIGPLTASDLLAWQTRSDLSAASAGRRLGCTPQTVRRWTPRKGQQLPRTLQEKLLIQLYREAQDW